MVRWCIRLTRLTLVCEVIRYRLVQVRQNQKKDFSGWRPAIAFLYLFLFHSLLCLTYFLSFSIQNMLNILPWKKLEPSSRFAARRTLLHVWYYARSGAISAGQKSRTVADRTCPALIAPDRAWYHTWNSVLLAANLHDGSSFVQGSRIDLKDFIDQKRDEKMYKKVWSDFSVYNTINREEIRRSRRRYTSILGFKILKDSPTGK